MRLVSAWWILVAVRVDVDGTPFGRYRLIELLGRGIVGDAEIDQGLVAGCTAYRPSAALNHARRA
jgi:hypothetical protein